MIEIELGRTEQETLVFSAYSFSSCVVPASSPLAIPLGILLSWIAFSDIGQNELHLRTLCRLLECSDIDVDVVEEQSGRQIFGRRRLKHAGKQVLSEKYLPVSRDHS